MATLVLAARLVGPHLLYALAIAASDNRTEAACTDSLDAIRHFEQEIRPWEFYSPYTTFPRKSPDLSLLSDRLAKYPCRSIDPNVSRLLIERANLGETLYVERMITLMEKLGWPVIDDWRRAAATAHATRSPDSLVTFIEQRSLAHRPVDIELAQASRLLRNVLDPAPLERFLTLLQSHGKAASERDHLPLLVAYGAERNSEGVLDAYRTARERGLPDSVTLIRTTMHALATAGDIDNTRHFFEKISSTLGVPPDASDYNALLKAAAVADDPDEFAVAATSKRNAGHGRDSDEYRRLLEVYASRSLATAQATLAEMESLELPIRSVHLLPIADAAVRQGDLPTAIASLCHLRSVPDDDRAIVATLQLAAQCCDADAAQHLALHLSKLGFRFSADACAALATALQSTPLSTNPAAMYRAIRAYCQDGSVALVGTLHACSQTTDWHLLLTALRHATRPELDDRNFNHALITVLHGLPGPIPLKDDIDARLLSSSHQGDESFIAAVALYAARAHDKLETLLRSSSDVFPTMPDARLLELVAILEEAKAGASAAIVAEVLIQERSDSRALEPLLCCMAHTVSPEQLAHSVLTAVQSSTHDLVFMLRRVCGAASTRRGLSFVIETLALVPSLTSIDLEALCLHVIRPFLRNATNTELTPALTQRMTALLPPESSLRPLLRLEIAFGQRDWSHALVAAEDYVKTADNASLSTLSRALQLGLSAARHLVDPVRAEALMGECEHLGCQPDATHFGALLSTYGRAGDISGCRDALARMRLRGLAPDDGHLASLAQAHCRSGSLDEAKAAIEQFSADGLAHGRITYGVFLAGCARRGAAELANWALQQLHARDILLDARHYRSAIEALIRGGDVAAAEGLFAQADTHRLTDVQLSSLELLIAGRAHELVRARRLYAELLLLFPNEHSYIHHAYLDALGFTGAGREAVEVAKQLLAISSFSVRAAQLTVRACEQSHEWWAIAEIADDLFAGKPAAAAVCLRAALSETSSKHVVEALAEAVRRFLKHGTELDTRSAGALIDGASAAGIPELAEEVTRAMLRQADLEADSIRLLYNLCLKAFARARRGVDARRLSDEMIARGISPDRYTLGTLQGLYDRAGTLSHPEASLRSSDAEQYKELAVLFDDVVHELNQPVGRIGLLISTLKGHVQRGESDAASTTLLRLEDCVRDLGERLGTYKGLTQGSSQMSVFEIREVVNQAIGLIRGRAMKAGITIDAILDETNPWGLSASVAGDAFLIRLAIRALITNAIDELEGVERPQTRRVIVRSLVVSDRLGVPWVDIYVRDNGRGIDHNVRARLFERGFTTKSGRGLGLGLSLVQSVAELHGGRVALVDEATGGAEFWLRLPAAEARITPLLEDS